MWREAPCSSSVGWGRIIARGTQACCLARQRKHTRAHLGPRETTTNQKKRARWFNAAALTSTRWRETLNPPHHSRYMRADRRRLYSWICCCWPSPTTVVEFFVSRSMVVLVLPLASPLSPAYFLYAGRRVIKSFTFKSVLRLHSLA